MKVWLGYSCYSDFTGSGRTLEKVFGDESKAKNWVGEMQYTGNTHPDYDWRECEEHEVE
jgi:hypothetical protein